jgi:hypothetical protein
VIFQKKTAKINKKKKQNRFQNQVRDVMCTVLKVEDVFCMVLELMDEN